MTKAYLGIELGSTRIKAVAIDEKHMPISTGDYTWASSYENGIWTYELQEAIEGLKTALSGVENRENIEAMGISAMMHGYLAFDKDWNLLVPFRTWQNTITGQAAEELTAAFGFNIPQRWSIAHLYQAVLSGEEHVRKIAHITTLAGYIHYLLTGVNAIGIGEASGMFPIDSSINNYDETMLTAFEEKMAAYDYAWNIREILPKVLMAGQEAGRLTEKGAEILGGLLKPGIPFAPAEGDAGTGMTATNAVAERTGNVSAGTSIFSMVVLEKMLSRVYPEIDMVTTPAGRPVAMVHCNNCTNDMNAWVGILKETLQLFGKEVDTGELYTKLYQKSLEGDLSCGDITVYNYMAGEPVTGFDEGRPIVLRSPNADFSLANFLRAQLYSTLATLAAGMVILEEENVAIDKLMGHGGLFKTPVVGQKYLAAATNSPVSVMETAGEGGPYGMALLAAFLKEGNGRSLDEYLEKEVFADAKETTLVPDPADAEGFRTYLTRFKKGLPVMQAAISNL
ncbi:MAG: ATPase [Christensenellaceae bacterium]|nr:ATPase [Christensenellaceae bacterium]